MQVSKIKNFAGVCIVGVLFSLSVLPARPAYAAWCNNPNTGEVSWTSQGNCPPGLTVIGSGEGTWCNNPNTGEVSWTSQGNCPPGLTVVAAPNPTSNNPPDSGGENTSSGGAKGECETGTEVTCSTDPGTTAPVDIDTKPRCDGSGFQFHDLNPLDNTPSGVNVSPGTDASGCIEFEEGGPLEQVPIFIILRNVVQFLLLSVGVGLVGVIVISGYQYIFARGNPEQTSKARDRIGYAIGGLILFALASVVMNWLVPGGLITG